MTTTTDVAPQTKAAKKAAETVEPKVEYGVFYVHESAEPLTNRYGTGVHGYVCTDQPAKRGYGLKKVIPTRTGFDSTSTEALRIIDSVVDIRIPLYEERDCATVANCLLTGINAVLEYVAQLEDDKRPGHVAVILPRKNLIGFLTKNIDKCIADGYKDTKGNPIPFKEGLDAYVRNAKVLTDNGVTVELIYGPPDGVMGMPEARDNAHDAVVAAIKCKDGHAEPSCIVSPPEGYWNHEHGRHPLLTKSRMVFAMRNGEVVQGDHLYLMDFDKSSKKKEHTHKIEIEVGQLLPSASYAVVKVKEPDPIIWQVAQEHSKYLDSKVERLGVLFLDAIYRPGAHSVMSKVGANYLYSKTVVTDLIDSRSTMYSHELNPARQAYRAWNTYLDMDGLLQEFLKAEAGCIKKPDNGQFIQFQDARGSWTATNITNRFIEPKEEKKGKIVYKASGDVETPNTAIVVKGFYLDEDDTTKEASVNLSIGIDMPKRNAISAMAGEETRAYLLLRQDTAFTVRHFVVVTNGDEYGIWTAPFANRTFVKK